MSVPKSGKLQVTVEVEGGCCRNVSVEDADGNELDFELILIDYDNLEAESD